MLPLRQFTMADPWHSLSPNKKEGFPSEQHAAAEIQVASFFKTYNRATFF
jgi:hypothetical protein